MDPAGRVTTRRYVLMNAVIITSVTIFALDILHFRPRPLTVQDKAVGILLVLMGVYTQTELRGWYRYYSKNAQNGCAPMPVYPNDMFGIRYFLEAVRQVRANALLESRQQRMKSLGHTFVHKLFPEPGLCVDTDDPEIVKTILATNFEDWIIPEIRVRGMLPVLGYHSIFTTNGPEWQHARAMLRPAFVRDQISDIQCFDRHVSKLIDRIPKDGSPFDLQALFAMLTIDTISDFMFGQSTDIMGTASPEALEFGACFDRSVFKIACRVRLGWLSQLLPDRELDADVAYMRKYVAQYVQNVKGQTEKDLENGARKYVFLHELIKTGEPDEVVRDQSLSIFLAGRDTTTSVLTYLFFELSRNPGIVAKIQGEIQGLGEHDPSWEQLRGMKYLNWAIKEALRLNPPVATNAREAVRDTILPTGGGLDGKSPTFVPKGTTVRYLPWSMQRREDIYGSDASEFRPERWEDLKVTVQYLPFNAGPRICIGQQFALTQMALITFRLLQAFNTIERKDERPPVRKLGVNTSMLYGCWVSMHRGPE
ncbi:hypothetical protein DL771_002434 [Monosporascus sp. 5C6A]|nr:hypothetical protein DL771_002434 [Monosporascus sp. 5C6A]